MVKLRLARAGAKKSPFYRVIVADERRARDGRFIEQIGTYDPMSQPAKFCVEKERLEYWLGSGAQPSEPLRRLLAKQHSEEKKEQVST